MKIADEETGKSSPRILIVDDEEIVLVALRDTLRRLGYRVTTTPDAVQGLSCLQEHRFSVVITDHQMPRLTGLEFLAQVRAIQPDATRVLITAVLNLTTVLEAINRAEVFRFLIKPWTRGDLLNTIRAAVERYETGEQHRRRLDLMQAECQALTRRIGELELELARRRPA